MSEPLPRRLARRALAELRSDSALWRRAVLAGVEKGPEAWLRYSPPVIGVGVGLALPWARARVLETLRHVHGPRPGPIEAWDVASVFGTYGSCLAEGLLVGSNRGYTARCSVVGAEHFDAAKALGRGVILATAHTAGWEVAGPSLRRKHDDDVVVVMEPERDEAARRLHDQARMRAGLRVLHVGGGPLDALPLLHHLRAGGVGAMQIDRAPTAMRTRRVTLFGQPFSLPEGPLKLSAVSGAPIVSVFTRRLGFLRYEVEVCGLLRVGRRPDEAELDRGAAVLAASLERFVRANPTQWFNFR